MMSTTPRQPVIKNYLIDNLIGVGDGPIPVRLLLKGLTAAIKQAKQDGFRYPRDLYFVPGYEWHEGDEGDEFEGTGYLHAIRPETMEEQEARETKMAEQQRAQASSRLSGTGGRVEESGSK